jgi:hypothetical protein
MAKPDDKCYEAYFSSNGAVIDMAYLCWGGGKRQECPYLAKCCEAKGLNLEQTRKLRRPIYG